MWWYLTWIIIVLLNNAVSAYTSKQANDTKAWSWVIATYISGCIGLWPLVARSSKNLVFDGFLYDTMIFTGFYITLLCLGAAKGFGPYQWTASILIFVGLILFKLH